MTVTLYTNNSAREVVNKVLTELRSVEGALRDECDITAPVLTMSGIDDIAGQINYAYIPDFGRYYYVNVTVVRKNLVRLTMSVDVLMSFKTQILANSALIERQELEYNLKLNDGVFATAQNPRIGTFAFPTGFTQWNYILALSGATNTTGGTT